MTDSQRNKIKTEIEVREGRVAWLYRDSAVAGNATCGIGHLVPDFTRAQALPFRPPIERGEWAALMTAPRGLRAQFYCIDTRGRLSDADIDAILESDIAAVEAELTVRWPDYPTFPPGPQAALLDMGFNLGVAGLLKFAHLVTAVGCKDWAACAASCHRRGISDARNAATAALFRQIGGS
jgi:GH24 family phage-related lysozyme (muramidase)